MTNPSIFVASGRARGAALLAWGALLASCGEQSQPPAGPRFVPTAAVAPAPSQAYFGAQFCEECIAASDQPPVQAF
jgi:hypothetical protein